jgi:cytochrome c
LKKYIIVFGMAAIAAACGNDATKTEEKAAPATSTTTSNSLSSNPDYQKGLELIGKSDCLTCHKVKEKNIGPAYQDVANKYENNDENIALLASKIIKGGSGVWGAIPMTPHPQISEDDAKQMVKYVLLLKK